MIEVLSADKCKEIDKQTIEKINIPSIILMENAAISIFDEIKNLGDSFLLICGKGNNGGDALALARHLILSGKKIKVFIVSKDKKYSDDFFINYKILTEILDNQKVLFIDTESKINDEVNQIIKNYDVVVDGLFGVGLSKNVEGVFEKIIFSINKNANKIVSIDVPSGLDCDTGLEKGIAIKADYTYTFEVIKKGFLNYNALKYIGKLEVLNIGIPDSVKEKNTELVHILESNEYIKMIPTRNIYGHKGNYGRALIFSGSEGFTGAAYITTESTVRAGAGLTTLICDKSIQKELSSKLIEAMTINFEDEKLYTLLRKANSIAIGPGIGNNIKTREMMKYIITNSKCPIIVDADGIGIIKEDLEILKMLEGRGIITPHPGEMANFLGITIDDVEKNRIETAKKVANNYKMIVLLKGYNTVISDGINVYINTTGNSKMASGGMGDSLTGIINAFLCQTNNMLESVLIGAYIHGCIGDELSKDNYIVNARDIIKNLPNFIDKLMKKINVE